MATLVIRDLDDEVKARLRVQAAEHGRSMEAEARAILAAAVRGRARRASRAATSVTVRWPRRCRSRRPGSV
jgi:plasmid stability protein